MLSITLRDWTGLELSSTEMKEDELGYDGNIDKLQRMAQNIANNRTASVKIEQDGKLLASASYLEGML